MAVDPSALYGPQVDTSDPVGYPQGQARNDTVSGDGTGTPLERNWVSDVFGFLQSILARSGVSPSGTPDKVGASQYLSALQSWTGWLSYYGANEHDPGFVNTWVRANGSQPLFSQKSNFPSGSIIYFSFPPGQRGTIETLRAHVQGSTGHISLPVVMPRLSLRTIDPVLHAQDTVATVVDSSPDVTSYELRHTIELAPAHLIDPTKIYFVEVSGERSGFSQGGLELAGVYAEVTGQP